MRVKSLAATHVCRLLEPSEPHLFKAATFKFVGPRARLMLLKILASPDEGVMTDELWGDALEEVSDYIEAMWQMAAEEVWGFTPSWVPLPGMNSRHCHLQCAEHLLCETFKVLNPAGRQKLSGHSSVHEYRALFEATCKCWQRADLLRTLD